MIYQNIRHFLGKHGMINQLVKLGKKVN